MLLANGMTEAVDWLKLKENELVKPKDIEPEPKPKQEDKRGNPGRRVSLSHWKLQILQEKRATRRVTAIRSKGS
jgi:hypothetical protein